MNAAIDTLLVFSHLRWDFVYQRPQHLLGRLAEHFRIIVVQEPGSGALSMEASSPSAGVTILHSTLPQGGQGFTDAAVPLMADLLGAYLHEQGVENYAVWFYTPMALPFLQALAPKAVIYDCMDELSGFRNAPGQLVARERTLLKIANAVFTGGPSLFEAKRELTDAAYCFPSSVDAAHFECARDPSIANAMYEDVARPALVSLAWSTSGSTSSCWRRWPPPNRIGRFASSGRW